MLSKWGIPLSSIEPVNTVQIIQKIDLRTFCRLQGTGSGIGDFLQTNPFKVHFHELGLLFSPSIYVTVYYINKNGEPVDVFNGREVNRIIPVSRLDEVGTLFDGLVFGNIRLEVNQEQSVVVLDFLQSHNISCLFLSSKHISFEATKPFARRIKPIYGLFKPRREEDFVDSLCSFRLKQAGLLLSDYQQTVDSVVLLLSNIPEVRLTCYFQASVEEATRLVTTCLQALLTDKTVQLKTFLMDWFVFDPNDALLGELISAIQNVLNIRLPPPHFNQYCFPFRSFAVELSINRRGTGIALPRPPRLSLQMDVKRR